MTITTTLSVFSRKVKSNLKHTKHLDHTYIQDIKNDYLWGCFGSGAEQDYPSTLLSERSTILKIPQCLSGADAKKNTQNHSEMYYGLQGVCHQAANRILSCVQEDVVLAKGYLISWFLYGTYGRQLPSELFYFFSNNKSLDLSSFKEINEAVDANMHSLGAQELPLILKKKNITVDAEVIELILSFRNKLNRKFSELLLTVKKPEDLPNFLDKINKELNLTLKEVSTKISEDIYTQFFDFKPEDIIEVFDPNIIS